MSTGQALGSKKNAAISTLRSRCLSGGVRGTTEMVMQRASRARPTGATALRRRAGSGRSASGEGVPHGHELGVGLGQLGVRVGPGDDATAGEQPHPTRVGTVKDPTP